MSSAAALSQVSNALQTLLQDELRRDSVFQTLSVVLEDPSRPPVANANALRLSLWLYQVVPDEFQRNLPPTPVIGTNGKKHLVKPPALALNLYYLVTPLTGAPDSDQRALGLAMLALHLNPGLTLHIPADGVSEDVRIGLVSDQLEDRVRLWESLSEPYRLSVCYLVRTVRLEDDPKEVGPRVAETSAALGEAPAPVLGVG